jgi:hypothetical protein
MICIAYPATHQGPSNDANVGGRGTSSTACTARTTHLAPRQRTTMTTRKRTTMITLTTCDFIQCNTR